LTPNLPPSYNRYQLEQDKMFRQIIAIFTLGFLGLSVSDKAIAQTAPTLYHDTDTVYKIGLPANSTVQMEFSNIYR
jgi:hypothetical protein